MNFSTHFSSWKLKHLVLIANLYPSLLLETYYQKVSIKCGNFHYIGVIFSICSAQLLDTVSFDSNWENLHYIRNVDLNKGFVKETDLIDIKI